MNPVYAAWYAGRCIGLFHRLDLALNFCEKRPHYVNLCDCATGEVVDIWEGNIWESGFRPLP